MKITAAVAYDPKQDFVIEEVEIADPQDHEILVKISGVGLCHTDLAAREQVVPVPLPAVLGHEGSGIVEKVGKSVTKVAVGDHVLLSFNSCGECPSCEKDLPSYCSKFQPLNYAGHRLDGSSTLTLNSKPVSGSFFGQSSFATYALGNEQNVVKVDKDIPIEILGPLGCGLQTGAGSIMRAMACPVGSTLVIFGGGPVGLAAVMGAVIQECSTIILVEPMEERRKLALELGAHHTIDPIQGNVEKNIKDILPEGVDFAFDSTGRIDMINAAVSTLAPHGLLGLVGVPAKADATLDINLMSLVGNGSRVQGIIEGNSDPNTFLPELIEYYKAGKFPFDRLITQYKFQDINQAIQDQAQGKCIKAVLIT